MNKSELIRGTAGTPTEIVRTLAERGVVVSLGLVKQVKKNLNRKARGESLCYSRRATSPVRGRKADEMRRLLGLGLSPAQIGRRYGENARNHAKQIAWQQSNSQKPRQIRKRRLQGIVFDVRRLEILRAFDVCDTELPSDYNIPVAIEEHSYWTTVRQGVSLAHYSATGDGAGEDVEIVVEVRKLVLEEPRQIVKRNWDVDGRDVPFEDSIVAMTMSDRRQIEWHEIPGIVAEYTKPYYRPALVRRLRRESFGKVVEFREQHMSPGMILRTILRILTP